MIPYICIILITYLGSGLAVACFVDKYGRCGDRRFYRTSESLILGFIFGPVLISFLIFFLFYLFPGKHSGLYIICVISVFSASLFASRRSLSRIFIELIIKAKDFKSTLCPDMVVYLIIFACLFSYLSYSSLSTPICGSDPVKYAWYGRYLYQVKDIESFPFQAHPETNISLNMQHLPGLPLVYTWFYLIAGDSQDDMLLKTVSPFYGALVAVLLSLMLWKRLASRFFPLLLLIITPVFYYQTIGNMLDPARIAMMLAIVLTLSKLLKFESPRLAVLLICMIALSSFMHIGGILLYPVAIITYVMMSRKIGRRLILLIACLALLAGSQLFFWNAYLSDNKIGYFLSLNPKFAGSSKPLEEKYRESAFGQDWIDSVKNNRTGIFEIYWKERLQILSRPSVFGPIFYIGLSGLVFWFVQRKKTRLDRVMATSVILISVPVLYKYYINYRYISTIVPHMAYFGAILAGSSAIFLNRRFGIPLKSIFLSASAICAAFITLLIFDNCRSVLLKMNESVYISLDNFAKWKIQSHPFEICMIKAAKATLPGHSILIIAKNPEPSAIYHTENRNIYILNENNKELYGELPSVSRQSERISLFFRKLNVGTVLYGSGHMDEYCRSNGIKNYLQDTKLASKIYSSRGYEAYKIKQVDTD